MVDIDIDRLQKAISNPGNAIHYLLQWPGLFLSSRGLLGSNIFEADHDLVVLLDTCRVDALRAVAPEFDFLSDAQIDSRISVGGTSGEWIAATFDKQYRQQIANTAYLASNGYARVILEAGGYDEFKEMNVSVDDRFFSDLMDWSFVSADALGRLDHLWKYEPKGEAGERGHPDGHSPPQYVTDAGIAACRENDFDKIILHYNQPHAPYTANALEESRDLRPYESDPFQFLRDGGAKRLVWESYLDNLRYALREVKKVLNNVDRDRVLISADHGEAFGTYGVYGHSWGSLHPHVRRVPWVEITANNNETYDPDSDLTTASERSVQETLEALGYK